MTTEREYCDSYVAQRSEEYEREVSVGNILLEEIESLHDAASGSFAGSIDALHAPFNVGRERLVECKTSLTFRGLGQLLNYTYFRRRDRELARKQYEARKENWETTQGITGLETHVYRKGNGADRTYQAKPAIEEINRVLAVGEIASSDALLLSAFVNYDVRIEHRTSGTWRGLDAEMFDTESTNSGKPTINWLKTNSRESLDSPDEEELWEAASEQFRETRNFKEVTVGSQLYPNRHTSLRADLVVRAGNHWFVVEVKDSTNNTARADFHKALGQAGAMQLFSPVSGESPQTG